MAADSFESFLDDARRRAREDGRLPEHVERAALKLLRDQSRAGVSPMRVIAAAFQAGPALYALTSVVPRCLDQLAAGEPDRGSAATLRASAELLRGGDSGERAAAILLECDAPAAKVGLRLLDLAALGADWIVLAWASTLGVTDIASDLLLGFATRDEAYETASRWPIDEELLADVELLSGDTAPLLWVVFDEWELAAEEYGAERLRDDDS